MTEIHAVEEYNAQGFLIYAENFPGAFVRGRTENEALAKFDRELRQYLLWRKTPVAPSETFSVSVVQKKQSSLQIQDADSDVIFSSELAPLSPEEYTMLKALTLQSASDFQALYDSVPDKLGTVLQPRKTFYGNVPITAEAMYLHTKNVNSYYFGEIGIPAPDEPDIVSCRREGFAFLENTADFLKNPVFHGSYEEDWTLRKVCRRFLWHDRIHAKALYKMAVQLCGKSAVRNPFAFTFA